ncbi:MAG: hypothetical protein WCL49_01785 [bacterium]
MMAAGVVSEITSDALHRDYPARTVVETRCLRDAACGIYPCYYRRLPDRLRVASSAVALIADLGDLQINPAFQPREYLLGDDARQQFIHGTARLPKAVKDSAKRLLPAALLRRLSKDRFWTESWETIDARVFKLKPFERVTPEGSADLFKPDFSLRNADDLVEGVACHLERYVREMEERYPEYDHVMMIGGKDSQILALIPKRNPERWHVFSAEPNGPLVREWLHGNLVEVGDFLQHDKRNDETVAETEQKIVCSDLYSDPRHMRWLPALRRIARSFDYRCFFWSGSAADALHVGRSFHQRYASQDPMEFFDIHLKRVPCLVGNYHQVVKNFTGCPLLCPYQTNEIWRDVYFHHGPAVIPAGVDLRPRLGERLAGRPIRWLDTNPGPEPYRYEQPFNARNLYWKAIRERLEMSG